MNFKEFSILETAKRFAWYGINNEQRFAALINLIKELQIDYKIQHCQSSDIKNIIIPATLNYGQEKTVIIAHYDVVTYEKTSGLLDNATAIAMILHMKKDGRIPENVEIVFDDQEECGLHGSKFYMENDHNIGKIINVDIIGIGDTIYYDNESGDKKIDAKAELFNTLAFKVPTCDHHRLADYTDNLVTLCSGFYADDFWHTLRTDVMPFMHGGEKDNDSAADFISKEILDQTANFIESLIS
ncbi:MAG: M28 family peptidase [Lentisphaeria bacterium]